MNRNNFELIGGFDIKKYLHDYHLGLLNRPAVVQPDVSLGDIYNHKPSSMFHHGVLDYFNVSVIML